MNENRERKDDDVPGQGVAVDVAVGVGPALHGTVSVGRSHSRVETLAGEELVLRSKRGENE